MSSMVKDNNVLDKYNNIWGKNKEKLKLNFIVCLLWWNISKSQGKRIWWQRKTNFLADEVPKENMHYICIACITIDSVMRMDKRTIRTFISKSTNTEQKIQMSRFINAKLESDSGSDSEPKSKSDTELMATLQSNSNSE